MKSTFHYISAVSHHIKVELFIYFAKLEKNTLLVTTRDAHAAKKTATKRLTKFAEALLKNQAAMEFQIGIHFLKT